MSQPKTPPPPPPSSLRVKSKPNLSSPSPSLQKSRPSDVKKVRRSLPLNHPSVGVAEQRKPHRLSDGGTSSRNNQEESISKQESLIKSMEREVWGLKSELEKALVLNKELVSRNEKLSQDLAAAQAKIAAFSSLPRPQEEKPKFKDIQKLVSLKLEHSSNGSTVVAAGQASLPPPPPPPPLRPLSKARAPKPPAVVQFFHALKRQEDKKDKSTAHSSIVGEIQNRSAHLLAIKADIETKGDFIKGLIQKVVTAAYTDIEDVLKFVDWLDAQLSSLVDERTVLKHFNWPERKADAIREAAIEFRGLKQLESEILFFKDDTSIPCGNALKKMAVLLDKSERGIQRLIKLRNSVMRSYQEWKIPTDWMLDSGIVMKIKQASMRLAKMYMGRVMMELELGRTSDRESNQEALLLQGVNFAYRTHQFAGGLDSETLCAFEEMRQRVPRHHGRCQELLLAGGIPSS